jgi:hypothetical protein
VRQRERLPHPKTLLSARRSSSTRDVRPKKKKKTSTIRTDGEYEDAQSNSGGAREARAPRLDINGVVAPGEAQPRRTPSPTTRSKASGTGASKVRSCPDRGSESRIECKKSRSNLD